MAEAKTSFYEDDRLIKTGVRRLQPANTQIFEGTFSLLHCAVQNDNLYRGVYAVLMFPIRYPDHFVSLRYTDVSDKDKEIGIIETLEEFPPEAQRLIRASLVKHYYEQIITRVYKVEYLHGLLFFKVETNFGAKEFQMRWSQSRAEEYGANGKVLLDSFDNRFIIPDITQLPTADRREFMSYIYW